MIRYTTSSLHFNIPSDQMDEIEQKIFPCLQEKYGHCEISISSRRDGGYFSKNDLTTQEEAFDFYASLLDEYYDEFKKLGMEDIFFWLTLSSDHSETNTAFSNLLPLFKYIDSFWLTTYQVEEETDE